MSMASILISSRHESFTGLFSDILKPCTNCVGFADVVGLSMGMIGSVKSADDGDELLAGLFEDNALFLSYLL